MKKLSLGMLIVLFVAFAGLQAAVTQVEAGADVLSAAISAAADGDVIELITDGGVYTESAKFSSISKSLTIRAAAGLTTKPVLQVTTGGDYVFKLTSVDGFFVFDGIEVDGTAGTGVADNKYLLRIDNADTTGTLSVTVLNSNMHDFLDKVIKVYANSGVDEVIVDNCIFADAREGVFFYEGSSTKPPSHVRFGSVTNSTFYRLKREAVKTELFDSIQVVVDHCTFYDIGQTDLKPMVRFRAAGDVSVTNSIFQANIGDGDNFIDSESNAMISNIAVWDVLDFDAPGTVTDTLHADPMFADAANGNFNVGNEVLHTYADDGGRIGDPRWSVVHQVAAGADVLSAAISAANSGEIIELTTDGGVYTESSKFSSVSKSLTIRAAEGLINKPVLQVTTGGDYVFKLTDTTGYFIVDGIEVDGSAGTGTAENKYFLRIDNGNVDGDITVSVKNTFMHDFTDKVIKTYANSGVDKLIVDNCVFADAREGVFFYEGSSTKPPSIVKFGSVTNSTFYRLKREAVKTELYDGISVIVDRCTFYDIGQTDLKPMVRFRATDNVSITNSIFQANQGDGDNFIDSESSAMISNIAVWDVADFEAPGTVTDTVHMDPGFADPANGDFSLPEGSPLLTFGSDAGAIGDPRWVPGGDDGYIVKVEVSGMGSVTKTPDLPKYDEGAALTLQATPDNENWKFIGWSENVITFPPDNDNPTITVGGNMLITAYFEPVADKYDVVIGAVGLGHVDTARFSDYAVPGFFAGDSIVLTATADTTTWVFDYWANANGESISTANPLSWIADGDSTWIAMFKSTITQYAFTPNSVGMGSFTVDPEPVEGFNTYDEGTVLTLTAEAAMGWEFAGWSGDLTGTTSPVDITMDADKAVTATFTAIAVPDGILAVDNSWDLRDAIAFSDNNPNVESILLTSVGPYEPLEEWRDNGKLPYIKIYDTLTIVGDETLPSPPVISGWGEGSSDGMMQYKASSVLTLKNLIFDGYFSGNGKATKYIFRTASDEMTNSFIAEDVEFFGTLEVFWKNYGAASIDSMILDNCIVHDIGKEGIYDQASATANYVRLYNSTFYDIAREVFRFKAWQPEMLVDHVTVHNCGYGTSESDSKYAAFKLERTAAARIQNCVVSDVKNLVYGYVVRMYGPESSIDNILFSPSSALKVDDNDGSINGPDMFWYDVMFADAANADFTLQDASIAYHLANDGTAAVGDLRWATSTNVTDYKAINLTIDGPGSVNWSPEPMGKFYTPGTAVTLHAKPDTAYGFIGWTGDVTQDFDVYLNLTMNQDYNITANFANAPVGLDNVLPTAYKLSQNYPNPFNPSTTIAFDLVEAAHTRLVLYDVRGREVARLVDRDMSPGRYTATFNGAAFASGIYFYRLDSGKFTDVKKLMLLK